MSTKRALALALLALDAQARGEGEVATEMYQARVTIHRLLERERGQAVEQREAETLQPSNFGTLTR